MNESNNNQSTKSIKNKFDSILTKISLIFDNEEEKEYAQKIIKQCIKDESFSDKNVIGYKAKVIKKLRELNILTKYKTSYLISFFDDDIELWYEYEPLKLLNLTEKIIDKGIAKLNKIKLDDKKYVCSDCEYKWESKKSFGEPAKCPRCNSKKIISFKQLNKLLN